MAYRSKHFFALAALAGTSMPLVAQAGDLDAPPEVADTPEAPTRVAVDGTVSERADHRYLMLGITGGVYALLYGYTYLAWYKRGEDSTSFQFHDEGWFGVDTYAGGADKLGHAMANHGLTFGVASILEWGGWSRTMSVATSTGAAVAFFTLTEIKDAYKKDYGFSWTDIGFNLAGNALGAALALSPELDRMIDFKIAYFPSAPYREEIEKEGALNGAEDYTGQTFYLNYHLSSIDTLRQNEYLGWTRFVDLSLGYQALHYKPGAIDDNDLKQRLFFGLAFNFQELIDETLWPTTGQAGAGVRSLRFFSELYAIPYTTLDVAGLERTAPDDIMKPSFQLR
jgi:hypothetical protein